MTPRYYADWRDEKILQIPPSPLGRSPEFVEKINGSGFSCLRRFEYNVSVFEALGFERRHTKDDLENREDIVGVCMRDTNGFHVDIVHSDNTIQNKICVLRYINLHFSAVILYMGGISR